MSNGSDERARAREALRREVREAADQADQQFRVEYGPAMTKLRGLSEADIRAVCPEPDCMETYAQLVAVVQDASTRNLAQAELKTRIVALGAVAKRIAGRIPQLAGFLG